MSQIKSYLSLESVPSFQFITPAKNNIQNMTTNNSMAFSQSLGTNDSKSNSYRNFLRSNEVFREFNYQLRDEVQQQSEEMINNNSSVTLHPTISKSDINELICTAKMILFLAGECEEKRQAIVNKKKGILILEKGVSLVEERLEQNQSLFRSKEKSIKSRSLSIQKRSMKKNKKLMNDIVDMKLDIKKMERTLSSKKQTLRTSAKKEDKNYFQTERKRRPIYIPVMNSERAINPFTNYNFSSPQPFFNQYSMHQHPFAQSMQPEYFHREHHRNNSQILSNSLTSDQNQLKNSLKRQSLNEDKNANIPSSNLNSNPIFNMLKSKLNGPQSSNIFQRPTPNIRAEIQRNSHNKNPEAPYSNKKPPSVNSNNSYSKQNSKIKINILPEIGPNLDYLNDSEEFSEQLLMNTNNPRKMDRSIKELKMSSKSNKWKNDEDIEEDRQLLKSLTSVKTIEHHNGDHPRSSMGAKIVQTHLRVEEENVSFDLPERSREEQSHSRSNNKSKIEVLFQNSQQKRNDSNSNQLTSKSPSKSQDRLSILNSQVGIVLHDVSDCQESPNKVSPRVNPSKNNNLLKEFPKIQEIEDDGYSRSNTPNDFSVFSKGFQPIRDSKLGNCKEEAILQQSFPTNKAQSQKSPPLSQPPSLIEQEEDMIDSIQLATNSKYSVSSLKKGSSLINKGSAISRNEEENDDDFLGGFKLATMSRVSREQIANSTPEKYEIQEDFPDLLQNDSLMHSKIKKKMTQSNLDEVKATDEKDELDDAIESNIRNSSTSVIVKKNKNSAIQRSVGHVDRSGKKDANVKSSLRGSYLSGQLSTPIAEAEEEQQQYSHIIKKHKRSQTDLYH